MTESETDEQFLDAMEAWVTGSLVFKKEHRERLFALARRGAAQNLGQDEKSSEDLYAAAREEYRKKIAEQAAEIERLRAENASLSSWQCEFTDGKTGLVYGQGGTTFCIMAKRMEQNIGQVAKLSEELERVKREAERAQDAHGVRFLNYLEETARLTDEITRLRAALRGIANMIPHAMPDYSHQVWKTARAALGEQQ